MNGSRIILVATVCALAVACSESSAPSGTVAVSDETPTITAPIAPPSASVPDPIAPEPKAPAVVAAVPVVSQTEPEAGPEPTAVTPPAVTPPADPTAPAYSVTCAADATAAEQCVVDKATYVGWRTFAGQCQVCHGGSALGSTFAPNLLDRFHERVDYPRFVAVVLEGYRGQVGAMPAWKGNPNVEPHIDSMYAYLKARADGVLPPGRPARAP